MGLRGRWSGLHGSSVRVRILRRMRKDRDEVKTTWLGDEGEQCAAMHGSVLNMGCMLLPFQL
uniref:Uncharacterized protein n=1 Tax=Vitis vinifera TaxID=29760 RepID=F6HRH8_VITVI